ncbi:MAG TPA: GNAT family protein [Anaerolineae bacterium]|nr:GNAT family protein [Anaerolineae bacterium]
MDMQIFKGELVRLTASISDKDAETLASWSRDSEFQRLLDDDPAQPRSVKKVKEEIEEEPKHDRFPFLIRTLADDRLIGFVGLGGVRWTHRDAWVGIGLGDREYWGKGYGTDAMRVVLRYAFAELNLHRVTLGVFEYNARAIRSYEKAGFVVEGRSKQEVLRDGRRWDGIYMGILRDEWEKKRNE